VVGFSRTKKPDKDCENEGQVISKNNQASSDTDGCQNEPFNALFEKFSKLFDGKRTLLFLFFTNYLG